MTDSLPDVPGGPQLRVIAMPRDANAGGHSRGSEHPIGTVRGIG
jgi:hypothetical protein